MFLREKNETCFVLFYRKNEKINISNLNVDFYFLPENIQFIDSFHKKTVCAISTDRFL